jgi:hypothetical protein
LPTSNQQYQRADMKRQWQPNFTGGCRQAKHLTQDQCDRRCAYHGTQIDCGDSQYKITLTNGLTGHAQIMEFRRIAKVVRLHRISERLRILTNPAKKNASAKSYSQSTTDLWIRTDFSWTATLLVLYKLEAPASESLTPESTRWRVELVLPEIPPGVALSS